MTKYTVKVDEDGNQEWYLGELLHRIDGPAVEYDNGNARWYLNGELHREDGPAIKWSNGDTEWWLNGKLHREDGPAVDYIDDFKLWYLKGVNYSEAEFNEKINPNTTKEISVIKRFLHKTCKLFGVIK